MPHASTFTRTCPAPGSGITRSINSQSPPALLICAAFIVVLVIDSTLYEIATLFAPILPDAPVTIGVFLSDMLTPSFADLRVVRVRDPARSIPGGHRDDARAAS